MEPVRIFHRYVLPLDVVIRTTGEDDLEELEWFGIFTPHRALIREAFERQMAGEVVMLIAEVNGFPAAQAWVDLERRAAASAGYIWAVRVIPILQSQGIGSRLLAEAEGVILESGLEAAELGVEKDNPGARRMYERAGYRMTHPKRESFEYRNEVGDLVSVEVDQWIMRKQLVPARGNRRVG